MNDDELYDMYLEQWDDDNDEGEPESYAEWVQSKYEYLMEDR